MFYSNRPFSCKNVFYKSGNSFIDAINIVQTDKIRCKYFQCWQTKREVFSSLFFPPSQISLICPSTTQSRRELGKGSYFTSKSFTLYPMMSYKIRLISSKISSPWFFFHNIPIVRNNFSSPFLLEVIFLLNVY